MPNYSAANPRLGPYSRAHKLAKLDGRSREARLIEAKRAALVHHVGGSPSPVQWVIIEQACQVALRIALMDKKFTETCVQTEHDSRTYLAWVGTYSRLMDRLGMAAAPSQDAPGLHRLLSGLTAL